MGQGAGTERLKQRVWCGFHKGVGGGVESEAGEAAGGRSGRFARDSTETTQGLATREGEWERRKTQNTKQTEAELEGLTGHT